MAQLVIYTASRAERVGRYRPGEVVAVVEDVHQFSDLELNEAGWRIVRVAGVPREAFNDLLMGNNSRLSRRLVAFELTSAMLARFDGAGVLDLSPAEAFELVGAVRDVGVL